MGVAKTVPIRLRNWFSSIWACSVAATPTGWALTSNYIGARAHADVHRLALVATRDVLADGRADPRHEEHAHDAHQQSRHRAHKSRLNQREVP